MTLKGAMQRIIAVAAWRPAAFIYDNSERRAVKITATQSRPLSWLKNLTFEAPVWEMVGYLGRTAGS